MSAHTALPRPFSQEGTSRAMFWWLVVIAVLVIAMIVVGGATRLTGSGLSITEWRPVTGAIPPMTDAGWQEELEKYRQIPQYQLQNRGMSMEEFQFIYWWEWGHRQLGRFLGFAFALPFAFFLFTRRVPQRLQTRLWVLFALGGLQGAIGWWMVASGLTERVSVSQYRLATHLIMAFAILGLTLWTALELRYGKTPILQRGKLFTLASAFWGAVLFQIALGALVAGTGAGRIFTTWPGFEGQLVPEGYLSGLPIWRAVFESLPAVQFQHRWVGYALAILGGVLAFRLWRTGAEDLRRAGTVLPVLIAGQVALGIWTLVSASPLNLSLAHQGGAIALFLMAGFTAWLTARTQGVTPAKATASV
ncbi:COX15/CtaA family protein [Glycocaulis sp.]|uniref:COX15/CtaA family protein n=1 Tax=Glycocaulis sp. TaxID=1969725 RepID=UPI003F6FCA43